MNHERFSQLIFSYFFLDEVFNFINGKRTNKTGILKTFFLADQPNKEGHFSQH